MVLLSGGISDQDDVAGSNDESEARPGSIIPSCRSAKPSADPATYLSVHGVRSSSSKHSVRGLQGIVGIRLPALRSSMRAVQAPRAPRMECRESAGAAHTAQQSRPHLQEGAECRTLGAPEPERQSSPSPAPRAAFPAREPVRSATARGLRVHHQL
ncbi:hypothetical protein NDU88_002598 [Pleurodeles waltl]|uniref:Uncharacterized protein n=1 Tax=Pleurodeles waltl TaxID=8319 RepID=A0AAV7T2D6_PLEWA|nr:hypothetical protein NDU88_002598 [Pleurodeles waltl]